MNAGEELAIVQQTVRHDAHTIPWRTQRGQRFAKRALDFIVAGVLLILTLPLIALTALLVRFTSPGPVLLAQARLGLNAELFKMLKFRSMMAETADGMSRNQGEVTGADARLTPVGGFIRAWRLDELPQLWHVLRGDMSLVGPRPDLPRNLHLYTKEQLLRFAMPPGCTAWTFTRGAFANDWRVRQQINVEYVRQWSFWLDMQIIFGSGWTLLRQKDTTPHSEALLHSTEAAGSPAPQGTDRT